MKVKISKHGIKYWTAFDLDDLADAPPSEPTPLKVERVETLQERVFRFVSEGNTKGPEFEALVKQHGRELLLALYRAERKKRKLSEAK